MEQKTRVILIALAAIIFILAALMFMTLSAKTAVEREREALKKDNETLMAQSEQERQGRLRAEEQLAALNNELDRLGRERDDLEKKCTLAERMVGELREQIKAAQAKAEAAAPAPEAALAGPSALGEDAYWAGILKAKKELEMQVTAIRSELKNVQIASEKVNRDRSMLELEVTNLKRENAELTRKIEYNQKLMDAIAQELVREKNDKMLIEESNRAVKNENNVLRQQLRALNTRKISLEEKIADIQDKNRSLDGRLKEMDTLLKEKMVQVEGLNKKIYLQSSGAPSAPGTGGEMVELPPIVVRPKQNDGLLGAQEKTFTSEGKVLAVNRENNFVVIDIGDEANVKVGDHFEVVRNGKSIASLEVIQVRRAISACDLKTERSPVKVGDTIR